MLVCVNVPDEKTMKLQPFSLVRRQLPSHIGVKFINKRTCVRQSRRRVHTQKSLVAGRERRQLSFHNDRRGREGAAHKTDRSLHTLTLPCTHVLSLSRRCCGKV
jgi:hypothetical protein